MAFDNKKLLELAISATGLIFDPATGHIFTINPTGCLIISALRDGKDKDDVKELVLKEYEIDEDTAERDLSDFITQLVSYELIKDA